MRRALDLAVEDGTVLSGLLRSDVEKPAPLVVMAHGFSGVKEEIGHYASSLASAGYCALSFDCRGFGESDGVPAVAVDPLR